MSLTKEEQIELVRLMNKLEFPVSYTVFEAWCRTFGTVCAEVLAIRKGKNGPEVFLTYRNDEYFNGWHVPGCIHLPTENIESTVRRVLDKEIIFKTTKPKFFTWSERIYGEGIGKSKRGNEISLVFQVEALEIVGEKEHGKFFPIRMLPADVLDGHVHILNNLKLYKI